LHKQKQNGSQQGRSNVDKSFASRERLWFSPVDYEIWDRLQERVYRSRVHDINHLMERLIEEWCDLDHNIICAAVNQWRARLRACVSADGGGHFEHQFKQQQQQYQIFNA